MSQKVLVILALVLVGAVAAVSVEASGFAVPIQGGRALGAGFAVSSDTQDLSCLYSNPAAMTQIKGTVVSIGTNNGYANAYYQSFEMEEEVHLEEHVFYLPLVGVISDFGTERFRAGLGTYAPYGARMNYPEEGPQRFLVQYADLGTLFVTAAGAYKITDKLSASLGFNYVIAMLTLQQSRIQPFNVGDGRIFDLDMDISVEADGTDFGWSAGLCYQATQKLGLGLAYTSGLAGDLEGAIEVKQIRDDFGPYIDPEFDKFEGMEIGIEQLKVEIPDIIRIGGNYQLSPQVKLLADFMYWRWSVWDETEFKLEPNPLNIDKIVIPRDWQDTITLVFGMEYVTPSKWEFRAGLGYDQNAIPDKTLDPTIPDADKYLISVGTGYTFSDMVDFHIGFGHLQYDKRKVTNSILDVPANGDYRYVMEFISWDLNIRL